MRSIAERVVQGQEEQEKLGNKNVEQCLQHIDPEGFWEELGRRLREGVRTTLEKTISYEFRQFIGALEYERSSKRKDVRNGYRSRDFGTIYGVIEDIQVPRARNSSFTTWILPRFKRRSGRIGRLISNSGPH
jgi:transposase-like protein